MIVYPLGHWRRVNGLRVLISTSRSDSFILTLTELDQQGTGFCLNLVLLSLESGFELLICGYSGS